jgi:2-C-methyl-D-erythritol 4-phosphate cytidylyltransferase
MNPKNKITVIIPAAGNSSRFGGSVPKQFLSLGDETVLEKSVNLFLEISYIREVIVAINLNENLVKSQSFYSDARVRFVEGGKHKK